jgi:hypothetical protein
LLVSLLQTLLLGNLSASDGAIDDQAIIETVQSFSKTIEQNPPLVKRRRDHLIASGMGSLGVMAGMLKGA